MAKAHGTRGWTRQEDAQIVACAHTGGSRRALAELMGRTQSAIEHRVGLLRQSGELPPARAESQRLGPRSAQYQNLGPAPVSVGPPLTLGHDDELVRKCLAEGGFPRPFVLEGRTFWITPDGQPWRHTPPPPGRYAT